MNEYGRRFLVRTKGLRIRWGTCVTARLIRILLVAGPADGEMGLVGGTALRQESSAGVLSLLQVVDIGTPVYQATREAAEKAGRSRITIEKAAQKSSRDLRKAQFPFSMTWLRFWRLLRERRPAWVRATIRRVRGVSRIRPTWRFTPRRERRSSGIKSARETRSMARQAVMKP
jgi:hypothetical protein